jgi:hypothetical protein
MLSKENTDLLITLANDDCVKSQMHFALKCCPFQTESHKKYSFQIDEQGFGNFPSIFWTYIIDLNLIEQLRAFQIHITHGKLVREDSISGLSNPI